MGLDYIGEVEIEDDKSIHSEYLISAAAVPVYIGEPELMIVVRCHKASAGAKPHFHTIDTRPGSEGGAIFQTGAELTWFNY